MCSPVSREQIHFMHQLWLDLYTFRTSTTAPARHKKARPILASMRHDEMKQKPARHCDTVNEQSVFCECKCEPASSFHRCSSTKPLPCLWRWRRKCKKSLQIIHPLPHYSEYIDNFIQNFDLHKHQCIKTRDTLPPLLMKVIVGKLHLWLAKEFSFSGFSPSAADSNQFKADLEMMEVSGKDC